jgi:hypothetical protein
VGLAIVPTELLFFHTETQLNTRKVEESDTKVEQHLAVTLYQVFSL